MGLRNNDVTDQQIIDLYGKMKSGVKVARTLGVSDKTVYHVLAANGIETTGLEEYRDRARAFDDKTVKHVVGRYQSGQTIYQIAKHYGVAQNTVRVSLRRAGVEIPVKSPNHISAAEHQEIVRLYKEVRSGNTVARMMGVSDKTVYGALAANGIKTTGLEEYRDRARAFDDEAMKDVIARYQSGETAAQIGKRYGISNGTVLNSLRNTGIEIRETRSPLSKEEKEEIVRLYNDRVPMKEIGKRLSRAEATVLRYLRAEHPDIIRVRGSRGNDASGWKGGRFIHKGSGYTYVKIYEDDPFWNMRPENGNGYILEHRLVMARKLGRPLLDSETVHHIDGDKTNNDPSNLELRRGKHGKNEHWRCLDCGSQNIGPAPLNSA